MGEMGEQGVEPVEFGYREPEPGCWTEAFDPRAIEEPAGYGARPESSSARCVWTAP